MIMKIIIIVNCNFKLWQCFLSLYLWAIKPLPKKSDGAKKLGGRTTAGKRLIVEG